MRRFGDEPNKAVHAGAPQDQCLASDIIDLRHGGRAFFATNCHGGVEPSAARADDMTIKASADAYGKCLCNAFVQAEMAEDMTSEQQLS
jgi:hypothetical protein